MSEPTTNEQAIIILDMARGYGWAPGAFGYDMVARVRRLKDAAYAAGTQVVHVNSMRRQTDNLPNASRLQPGTDAVGVIDELQPVDRDILIFKRFLSGFSHNDLDYTLRTMGCKRVLIAGASTDNTVLWTAADAHQNRYDVAIVEDCTMVHRQQEPPGAQEGAIRIMRGVLHADIVSLDEAIAKYLRPNSRQRFRLPSSLGLRIIGQERPKQNVEVDSGTQLTGVMPVLWSLSHASR